MSQIPHIVYMDDNAGMLVLVENFIQSIAAEQGIEVMFSTFGSSQSIIAARDRPQMANVDLFLLDFDMPLMSGDEVCARLREYGYDSPIIFMSALQDSGRKELARQAGADAYSQKVAHQRAAEQFTLFIEIAKTRVLPDPAPDWLEVFHQRTP